MKRLLAIFLSLMLVISAFTGCGSNTTDDVTPDDSIVIEDSENGADDASESDSTQEGAKTDKSDAVKPDKNDSKPGKEDKNPSQNTENKNPSANEGAGNTGNGGNSGSETAPEAGGSQAAVSVAAALKSRFNSEIKNSSDITAVANKIAGDSVLADVNMAVAPVSPGYLSGFTSEVNGFTSGVVIQPLIGSMPFIAYIFETENADALVSELNSKYDLRWNICTSADEREYAKHGNYVFFVMAPTSFESEM